MPQKNKPSALSGQLAPVTIFINIIILLLVAIVLSVALFSYQPSDPAWSHNSSGMVQNQLGVVGAWYSDLSFSILGKLGYLLPLALFAFAVQIWLGKGIDKEILSWRLFMLLTAILSGCVLFTKHDPVAINEVALTGGGALGAWLTIGLEKSIKSIPVIMAFSAIIFLISLTLLFNLPWLKVAEWLGKGVTRLAGGVFSSWKAHDNHPGSNKFQKSKQKKSVTSNDELQENIQRLNNLVDKQKKTNKPTFSIDRYEPEEAYCDEPVVEQSSRFTAVGEVDDNFYDEIVDKPAFQTNKRASTSIDKVAPISVTGQTVKEEKSIDTVGISKKAEPNFFNFEATQRHTPVVGEQAESIFAAAAAQEAAVNERVDNTVPAEPLNWVEDDEPLQPVSETPETQVETDALSLSNVDEELEEIIAIDSTIEPGEALLSAIQGGNQSETIAVNEEQEQVVAHPPVSDEGATTDSVQPQSVAEVADSETLTAANSAKIAQPGIPTKISKVSIGKAYDSREEEQAPQPAVKKKHILPSIDLLDTPPPQENAYTEDVLAEMAGVLERTLKQFNVEATVMHVSPGPVITRFEIDLAPGIQAKKITSLSVDLARALAVSGVRVEEVIPGSSYVGLEVPNKQRQIVYFKDVVRSKAFQSNKSPLTVSLGSDTSGKPVTADLMKMPHALVAGTTGSGKSVCINVMLLSMLYKATPKDLRLILVDPKMLEMSMYEDIPHLLTPVITDMNEAENALTWAVGEMERRYQLMAALKVRKIDAFNQTVEKAIARGEPIKDPLWNPDESVGYTHHPELERLPFIVIVIDELADMMMVVGKQVEQLIARLTQKARAAGIHVVLATQRPSTDVLTGLIKANVPTRIAFQVSSGTDSRVIIDSVGAEKLLGHGDMLFVPPGAGHPQRLHGAFVDDAETDRITTFLRSMGEPDYIDGITGKQDPETLGAFGAAEVAEAKEDADPLYEEAIQIVLQTGKASISSVQRQLRIGYNRAARMIEDMQEQGIVSEPVNGVRKVLAAVPPSTE